jgi:hypothetical protein
VRVPLCASACRKQVQNKWRGMLYGVQGKMLEPNVHQQRMLHWPLAAVPPKSKGLARVVVDASGCMPWWLQVQGHHATCLLRVSLA